MAALEINAARSNFPALSSGFIFADNAGGSQASKTVVDRISDYLLHTNVQLGADYVISTRSTSRVAEGAAHAATLFNATSPDEIVFSGSSTMNLENLTRALECDLQPGDEFIVTGEHEANVGPWKKLAARRGIVVKNWTPTPISTKNPYSVSLKVPDLLSLITSRTRIVAFTACSNILGSIIPVKDVVHAVRAEIRVMGAQKVEVCVDCVAYAPHRQMDVQEWDVDFCVFSFYKVYGPHISAMYIRGSSLRSSVTSLAHHFLTVDSKPYKLEPGGPGYELVYGSTGVLAYLLSLTPAHDLGNTFEAIAQHEQGLLSPLLTFLTHDKQFARGVRVVGDEALSLHRVPTVSFIIVGDRSMRSTDVVAAFDRKGGIGIRYGHFYAYTLVKELHPEIDVNDGVVRISLVHYNTVQEVEEIVRILAEVLG